MTHTHQTIAAMFALLSAQGAYAQRSKQVPLLPRDLEIELALNAAPAHLRDGATVLVLEPAGFVKAREGTNRFTCLVTRAGGDVFPVCYDEEGTRSVLPVDLDDTKLRLQGMSSSEIDRQIAEGFKEGRYRAPSRPGISYMLSPIRYRIDEQGHIVRAAPNPHIMFYAPYLSDADIGGVRGSLAFINRVGPHGMMIVPVGQKERAAILSDSQALIEKFERQIGFHYSDAAIALPMAAPQQPHAGAMNDSQFPPPERLGTVHFETSCVPAVKAKFDRAVALLHSFWFPAAIAGFYDVLKEDPSCGIAYWGIALSTFNNPFGGGRSPKLLQDGLAVSQKAETVGAKTERERDYIAAVGELYKDSATLDEQARKLKYEAAMEQLARKYPNDSEAQIFCALAIVQTAVPTDKTYSKQLKAVSILEEQLKTHPDHPGIAHYIIHSYDAPALAPRGLPAARVYANIAPSAPHALHMPSHIFTRVGDWDASIAANIKSAATSRKVDSPGDELHADDYLTYAYLQEARDQAAKRVLDDARQVANNPENLKASGMAGSFALAAIAARYAIEREAWSEATALEVHPSPMTPFTDAMTRFVRAVGFAQTGDADSAKAEVAELAKLHDALVARKDAYWSEQVEIQRISASAWAARADGKQDDALALMRSAAEREDATDKSAITPGPLKPVREQLGEMLLAANQPAPALLEFEATLKKEPNRFRSVYGAARAAELSGDRTKAGAYYRQLLEICKQADSSRPELKQAREFIAQAPQSAQR